MSERRSYTDEHIVYFLDVHNAEPVFHGFTHGNVPDITDDLGHEVSRDITVCGQLLSSYTRGEPHYPNGHLRDFISASLPLKHALRFGRPCKKCFIDPKEAT